MARSLKNSLWTLSLRGVDQARRLKHSSVFRRLPGLKYTYLFDVSRVIVVPELELAFVPTPKVANRSIKAAVAVTAGKPFGQDPHQADWQYTPLAVLRDHGYYSFGFVRNPLARLVSCYAQKIVLYGREYGLPLEFWRYGDRFFAEMEFEQFVHAVAEIPDAWSDIHFRSQHTFFCHRGRMMVDHVGHYERLSEDWGELSQRFGFPSLPHYNRSVHDDYRRMYSPRLARLAASRYREDIDRFGYTEEIAALME